MMHIDFPVLFAEAFFWALLMGVIGARKWLAAGITIIVVSCMHIGQIGMDLFLAGSNEAYGWLAFLSIGVLVPVTILASIGSSIGGLAGQWIVGLFRSEQPVDEVQDEAQSSETA